MSDTYPGTNLLVRICYGCDNKITELNDVWVDVDSNCCVCSSCRERAHADYATHEEWVQSIVPGRTLDFDTVNEMQEG